MTGNLFTLADARTFLRRFVNEGSCGTDEIDDRIAECERRLWRKPGLRLSTKRVRIRVQNQCFPLPIEAEKLVHVDVDGTPGHIFNQAYEFLTGGPGDLDYDSHSGSLRNVQDLGEFPTMFDIPVILTTTDDCASGTVNDGFRLYAFSPYVDDGLKYVTVRGLRKTSDEIYSVQSGTDQPGEQILINQWRDGVEGEIQGHWEDMNRTTALFAQATRVYKPVTKGPVCVYAIDETNNRMYLLSKMTPETTVPSYRRYRLTHMASPQPGATATEDPTHDSACVLAIVKLRHVRATRATDVLCVQNLEALKNMSLAVNAENKSDYNGAQAAESQAIRLLMEEYTDREEASGMPTVINVDAELTNGYSNRGYLI